MFIEHLRYAVLNVSQISPHLIFTSHEEGTLQILNLQARHLNIRGLRNSPKLTYTWSKPWPFWLRNLCYWPPPTCFSKVSNSGVSTWTAMRSLPASTVGPASLRQPWGCQKHRKYPRSGLALAKGCCYSEKLGLADYRAHIRYCSAFCLLHKCVRI